MPTPKSHGFTLTEMVIVISIVGVLAAIAAPQYQSYMLQEKISKAVGVFSSMRADLLSNLQQSKSPPENLNGVLWSDGIAVSGKATDTIEGFRFHGNGTDVYWFAMRLKDGILPGTLDAFKREIHYGLVKTNSGNWTSFCGSWDNGSAFIATKYLPPGCNEPNIYAALKSAKPSSDSKLLR